MRVREPSVSEPLMRCRNVMDDVRTGVLTMSQDKSRGNLLTAWVASGIKVAGNELSTVSNDRFPKTINKKLCTLNPAVVSRPSQ